jgi:hypothetical protein
VLGRAWVKDIVVDALGRVDTALDSGDAFLVDIADVVANLLLPKLIHIGNAVVVRVSRVILSPVSLEGAAGVFFIVITFRGFFCGLNTP